MAHRLKGDGNAYQEIGADSMDVRFSRRMCRHVWRLRPDWICTSTAVVRACSFSSRSGAGAADAVTDRQSIQSRYCATAELQVPLAVGAKHHTGKSKHHIFNAEHRSKYCGHVARE